MVFVRVRRIVGDHKLILVTLVTVRRVVTAEHARIVVGECAKKADHTSDLFRRAGLLQPGQPGLDAAQLVDKGATYLGDFHLALSLVIGIWCLGGQVFQRGNSVPGHILTFGDFITAFIQAATNGKQCPGSRSRRIFAESIDLTSRRVVVNGHCLFYYPIMAGVVEVFQHSLPLATFPGIQKK